MTGADAPAANPQELSAYQQSAPYVRSADSGVQKFAQGMRSQGIGIEKLDNVKQSIQDVGHRMFQLSNLKDQQGGKLTKEQEQELAKIQDVLSTLANMQYKLLNK